MGAELWIFFAIIILVPYVSDVMVQVFITLYAIIY